MLQINLANRAKIGALIANSRLCTEGRKTVTAVLDQLMTEFTGVPYSPTSTLASALTPGAVIGVTVEKNKAAVLAVITGVTLGGVTTISYVALDRSRYTGVVTSTIRIADTTKITELLPQGLAEAGIQYIAPDVVSVAKRK